MNTQKNATKQDPLVISRTDEGFRVYAAADPSRSYTVSGSADDPSCTCADFQHPDDSDVPWFCKHILAVLDQVRGKGTRPSDSNNDEVEERLAIQQEGNIPNQPGSEPEQNDRPTHMFIKRSVSPDGRIDSLSVEFSCPVDKVPVREIKSKAATTLQLQAEIVENFLQRNGSGKSRPAPQEQASNGAAEAMMLTVGGQDGKWGRRLFLVIRSNGSFLKLFGSRKQLQEHLAAAGFGERAKELYEGMQLNLPCRIITKPSDDGRWLNVEQVLPANSASGRSWR